MNAWTSGTLPYFSLPYRLLKRSIRPAVSTIFWVPVKKGWQAEQISTSMLLAVVWS